MLNAYLTSFFNAWLDYQNLYGTDKRYTTGFIPRVLMINESIEGFMRDFPDGYIISSIRHPAGWYSSAKIHGYQKRGKLEDILRFWIQSCESIARAKNRWSERMIVIRFEDLVRDPSFVMREISNRLSLTWSAILTTPTFNSIPVDSNSNYKTVKSVDATVADAYVNLLDGHELSKINSMTESIYRRMNQFVDVSCE